MSGGPNCTAAIPRKTERRGSGRKEGRKETPKETAKKRTRPACEGRAARLSAHRPRLSRTVLGNTTRRKEKERYANRARSAIKSERASERASDSCSLLQLNSARNTTRGHSPTRARTEEAQAVGARSLTRWLGDRQTHKKAERDRERARVTPNRSNEEIKNSNSSYRHQAVNEDARSQQRGPPQ